MHGAGIYRQRYGLDPGARAHARGGGAGRGRRVRRRAGGEVRRRARRATAGRLRAAPALRPPLALLLHARRRGDGEAAELQGYRSSRSRPGTSGSTPYPFGDEPGGVRARAPRDSEVRRALTCSARGAASASRSRSRQALPSPCPGPARASGTGSISTPTGPRTTAAPRAPARARGEVAVLHLVGAARTPSSSSTSLASPKQTTARGDLRQVGRARVLVHAQRHVRIARDVARGGGGSCRARG